MIVVAAAIERDGRVLAAHRRSPVGWEFPGGKVEAGESEAAALVRECLEELGVGVVLRERVGSAPINAQLVLHLYRCVLVAGEPAAGVDHDELRWIDAGAVARLDWLPADRALLPSLDVAFQPGDSP